MLGVQPQTAEWLKLDTPSKNPFEKKDDPNRFIRSFNNTNNRPKEIPNYAKDYGKAMSSHLNNL